MRGIRKLKSGKYQARYFAGLDQNGKKVYPSKTFTKQADAIKWRNTQLVEKETGLAANSLDMTVDSYLARWFEMGQQRMRRNTAKTFSNLIRLYITPHLGNMKLRALDGMHVESWQALLLKELSPVTVRDARNLLSQAMNKAVRLRLVSSNPVKQADPPKVERVEMRVFTRDQAVQFLDYCEPSVWGTLFVVMLKTGIRPEEALGLQWSALDLEGCRLHVLRSLVTYRVRQWELQPPKTNSSRRIIAFPSSLSLTLADHRRRQLEERLAAGGAYINHDLVFANPIGEPLAGSTVRVNFKRVLKRAGLPDIRLYDLRHSFVTLSILAGIDLKTVSADAGHSTVAFTLDNYGHVLEAMRSGAAEKREMLFSKSSAG